MRLSHVILVTGVVALASSPALAWWDEGHMQIAAVAWSKMTPKAQARAAELLKLNPDYKTWTAGLTDHVDELAFVRAATWADDIKMDGHGHTSSGDTAKSDGAGENIGYGDNRMHKYWHFMDIGFSTDGTHVEPADSVNALTQINLLKAALPASSGATDELRSYDLVWLLHLVGDVHQPLHATARFSKEWPHGDQGGNKEIVKPASGETLALHFYWDRVFGGYSTPQGAILDAEAQDGLSRVAVDPAEAAKDDPAIWLQDSAKLARQFAYAEPVLSGSGDIELTREYETKARGEARKQAALAAARLANMLNAAFP